MERDAPNFTETLSRIEGMLVETGWMMRKDVVRWIACLGHLVAAMDEARSSCARWILKIADELSINHEDAFRRAIVIHLPFTNIRPDASQYVWSAVANDHYSSDFRAFGLTPF